MLGNGNGTFQVIGGNLSTGTGLMNNWSMSGYSTLTADVNGDGKSDVVLVAPTTNGLYVYTMLGNGDGTFQVIGGNPSTGTGLMNNWSMSGYSTLTADVNGDGKSDVVLVAPTTSGLYVYTMLGNGNGTFQVIGGNLSTGTGLMNNWSMSGYSTLTADVNGDGKSDVVLVAPTTNGLYVYTLLGNGNGTFQVTGTGQLNS